MIIPFIQWTVWSSWEQIGERFLGGAGVAATSRDRKILDLFAVEGDGQMYTLQWTKEERWSKNPLPREIQGFPTGAQVTATARTEQHMDLFVCDSDGNVKTLGWSSLAGWTDWELIGRQFLTETEIATIVPNENTLEIFACRPNGQIYNQLDCKLGFGLEAHPELDIRRRKF
ncbi:hypothetical protein V2W45_564921 [Cenococcum geophilum]